MVVVEVVVVVVVGGISGAFVTGVVIRLFVRYLAKVSSKA